MKNHAPKILTPVVVALLLTACGSPPATMPTTSSAAVLSGGSMMTLVNDVRAQKGLPALRRSVKLDAVSQGHGQDMAVRNYFSHTSPSGVRMADRIKASGYGACTAAENIGYGSLYADPAKMMAGWMASPGHRSNLLHPRVTEVGFAKVADPDGSHDPLWVMNLARPGC